MANSGSAFIQVQVAHTIQQEVSHSPQPLYFLLPQATWHILIVVRISSSFLHADAPPLPWPLQAAHFPDGGLLIRDTLLAGTAIAICNGSYMPTRFPHLAALAWILHPGPSSPGIPRHGMTQVHSWPQVINSYQVEWQGLYMLLLALEHICTLHQIQLSSITIGCDNKGVLHHAHHPSTNIPCVFKHADLIQAVHALQQQCPVHLAFQYVVGHQEDFV